MRYYLKADPGDDVENGYAVLLRLEDGYPMILAEALLPATGWTQSESLARYHLRGSTDVDINEITAEQARAIAIARHANGRLAALPDPLPGEAGSEKPERSAEERELRERWRAHAAPLEAQIMNRYAALSTPPGAVDISVDGRPPGSS